jgi:hypothetical protein
MKIKKPCSHQFMCQMMVMWSGSKESDGVTQEERKSQTVKSHNTLADLVLLGEIWGPYGDYLLGCDATQSWQNSTDVPLKCWSPKRLHSVPPPSYRMSFITACTTTSVMFCITKLNFFSELFCRKYLRPPENSGVPLWWRPKWRSLTYCSSANIHTFSCLWFILQCC